MEAPGVDFLSTIEDFMSRSSSMRLLIGLLAVFALVLPTQAAPEPPLSSKAHTLISVSRPGYLLVEEKGLCSFSPPGKAGPLKIKIVPGLSNPKLVSLEVEDSPGYFLRHQNSRIKVHPFPESDGLFAADATFYLIQNPDGTVSFRSYNYPNQYLTVTAGLAFYISVDPDPVAVRSFRLGN